MVLKFIKNGEGGGYYLIPDEPDEYDIEFADEIGYDISDEGSSQHFFVHKGYITTDRRELKEFLDILKDARISIFEDSDQVLSVYDFCTEAYLRWLSNKEDYLSLEYSEVTQEEYEKADYVTDFFDSQRMFQVDLNWLINFEGKAQKVADSFELVRISSDGGNILVKGTPADVYFQSLQFDGGSDLVWQRVTAADWDSGTDVEQYNFDGPEAEPSDEDPSSDQSSEPCSEENLE